MFLLNKFKKNKNPAPLRRSMMVILILFWLIPMLVIIIIFTTISTSNLYSQVSDITASSAEYAIASSTKSLESIVYDSARVNYAPELKTTSLEYERVKQTNVKADIVYQKTVLTKQLEDFLNIEYLYTPEIKSAYFILTSSPNEVFSVYNKKTEAYSSINYYNQVVNSDVMQLSSSISNNIKFLSYEDGTHFYMARAIQNADDNFTPYAMLVLEINQELLFENIQNLQYSVASTIAVDDIRINLKGEVPDDLVNFPGLNEGMKVSKYSKDYVLCEGKQQTDKFSLDYYILTNIRLFPLDSSMTIQMVLWVALLIAIMTAAVFLFFKNRMSSPISQLTGLCKKIESGYFGATVNPSSMNSEEFMYLCTQLNTMSKQLQNQFNKIYEEEISLRDARIKALQGQINPHFLGNTLEIINWEVRMEGNNKAANMLEALSTMLDGTLDRNKKPLIHLSEELMYINAYLTIIKERMGKRLTIEREIDESLLDWYVPRLILQPIVENAIEHGADQQQQSKICIRAYRKNLYWIILEVENDSPLLPADVEKINDLLSDSEYYFLDEQGDTKRDNIGIKNVNQRLHLLYGDASGLSFHSRGNNTVATILIADTTKNNNPKIDSKSDFEDE